jgi:hypothetical protein
MVYHIRSDVDYRVWSGTYHLSIHDPSPPKEASLEGNIRKTRVRTGHYTILRLNLHNPFPCWDLSNLSQPEPPFSRLSSYFGKHLQSLLCIFATSLSLL